jgi:hypothetical protein
MPLVDIPTCVNGPITPLFPSKISAAKASLHCAGKENVGLASSALLRLISHLTYILVSHGLNPQPIGPQASVHPLSYLAYLIYTNKIVLFILL